MNTGQIFSLAQYDSSSSGVSFRVIFEMQFSKLLTFRKFSFFHKSFLFFAGSVLQCFRTFFFSYLRLFFMSGSLVSLEQQIRWKYGSFRFLNFSTSTCAHKHKMICILSELIFSLVLLIRKFSPVRHVILRQISIGIINFFLHY